MKIIRALLISLLVMAIVCGGCFAYGQIFKTVHNHITIIPAVKTVGFYIDPACTQEFIQPAWWGTEIAQGQVVSQDLYLKNKSLVQTNLNVVTANLTWGKVTFSPSGFPKLMQPGEVYKLTVFVTPNVDAPVGDKEWDDLYTD